MQRLAESALQDALRRSEAATQNFDHLLACGAWQAACDASKMELQAVVHGRGIAISILFGLKLSVPTREVIRITSSVWTSPCPNQQL